MTMTFTILGCGSSMGVPRPALGWGDCDPANPKNRRRRTSLLAERSGPGGLTRVLIDTSPDLREQLLDAKVDWLDGVLISHEHADHVHGIDDLRPLFVRKHRQLDVYMSEAASRIVRPRFEYCFATPAGSQYPPIANERPMRPGHMVRIEGEGGPIEVLPLLQQHGDIISLGFRFGSFGYSCDLSDMPDESAAALMGLDVWVVDALRYKPHPSHFSLADALTWIGRLKPKRAILTNLHADLDYETLCKTLPSYVEPAYDGISLTLTAA
jgi:phosphoribosyl 1,2-cyclic phosphate phosphodiesterase